MTMDIDEQYLSDAEIAAKRQFEVDTYPTKLPVPSRTWVDEKIMGIDVTAGSYEFLDDGSHIWQSFFDHWGWWKTTVLGWYPYTELRDYHLHEQQGIGRPWLSKLPDKWQELIFRELVLLVTTWNDLVKIEHRFTYTVDEDVPNWMQRWLSLTNRSWRLGFAEFEREIYESASEGISALEIAKLVQRYQASAVTWRPIMPETAEYHRRYGDRGEFWSFERD